MKIDCFSEKLEVACGSLYNDQVQLIIKEIIIKPNPRTIPTCCNTSKKTNNSHQTENYGFQQ